ncbi:UNVERIFIED_CONTAM: hypothetical protein FKN15_010413 [Acipenser sinensis]
MAGTVMLAYYFEYTDTFNVHVQGFFCYDSSYTKPYPGPEEISAIPPALLYSVVAGVPTLVLVIMAGTVMLAYYFEYTDTFNVHVQGFFCYDSSYTKPYPGPEEISAIPPALLYSVVAGVPTLVIFITECVVFYLQIARKDFENREKTIVTGDCCYLNPLVRRTVRFLEYPVYIKRENTGVLLLQDSFYYYYYYYYYHQHSLCSRLTTNDLCICVFFFFFKVTGSKCYNIVSGLTEIVPICFKMYITNTMKAKGSRLAKPVLCLGLMCMAFLTGVNRVAEYRNHWSDVIAGFIIAVAIATFLVVCVVHNFKRRHSESQKTQPDSLRNIPMINLPRVESPMEKYPPAVQVNHYIYIIFFFFF